MAETLMAMATRAVGALQEGNSFKNGKRTLDSASQQQRLIEIGGEPLVSSGFESEVPESEFERAGEES
jgi:hypothetical protein